MHADRPYHAYRLGEGPFASALTARILHRHAADGWDGLVSRVVAMAARAEQGRSDACPEQFLGQLSDYLATGALLPNSPLLVNAGEQSPRIFACFAVDVADEAPAFLRTMRFIHDGMGGVGYTLTGTEQDFAQTVRMIDRDTSAHQHGRPRPASNAVTMPISGDLDTFLGLAGTLSVTNMNVGLSDAFMADLASDATTQRKMVSVAEHIHRTGQPGVVFTDRITRIAQEPHTSFAANVCGEAPLAVDESALLASINLVAFVSLSADRRRVFDWVGFAQAVAVSVRMLDGMHDLQTHASERIAANTNATRKVGVGVMGFAHALMLLGLPYGQTGSLAFARQLSCALHEAAERESCRLAARLGPYPAWQAAQGRARRNASLTAIAGTATIALLVGVSCGIEPLFAHIIQQRVIDAQVNVLDPVVAFLVEEAGLHAADVEQALQGGQTLRQVAGDALADLCPTALELPGPVHIDVQAALQSGIDCGITKTINCRAETSVEDIHGWLVHAHAQGCLGLTIYRNLTLSNQPMQGPPSQ